jgi:hypothetical protein
VVNALFTYSHSSNSCFEMCFFFLVADDLKWVFTNFIIGALSILRINAARSVVPKGKRLLMLLAVVTAKDSYRIKLWL